MPNTALRTRASRDTVGKPRSTKPEPRDPLNSQYPEPDDADQKWPLWITVVFVVGFCAAFWSGVGYLAAQLFG